MSTASPASISVLRTSASPTDSHARFDRQEPEILAIYDRVLAECGKRKLFAGIHTGGADDAAKCIARGFRLVTLTNDVSLMAIAARGAVAQTRKESKGVA